MQAPRERGPAAARAILVAELRRLRAQSGDRQQDIAEACEWSLSKATRVENGQSVAKSDLVALLFHYGVTGKERVRELAALARAARQEGWWEDFRPGGGKAFLAYIGYEFGASVIRVSESLQIPGLLQTPGYTAAVLKAAGISPDISQAAAKFNQERQRQVAAQGPRQEYVIDESVLSRPAGDADVMPAQLHRLVDAAQQPGVTIRVVPRERGFHFGLRGPFTLLDLGVPLGQMLYAGNELQEGALVSGTEAGEWGVPEAAADADAVAEHIAGFEDLSGDCALGADESLELIEKIARDLVRAGACSSTPSRPLAPATPRSGRRATPAGQRPGPASRAGAEQRAMSLE